MNYKDDMEAMIAQKLGGQTLQQWTNAIPQAYQDKALPGSTHIAQFQQPTAEQRFDIAMADVQRLNSRIDAYKSCGIPTPKEVYEIFHETTKAAQAAYRDMRKEELERKRKEYEELRSREEKREDLAKQIAEIEEELG